MMHFYSGAMMYFCSGVDTLYMVSGSNGVCGSLTPAGAQCHKAQGATVDRSFVLATPGMDRHLVDTLLPILIR
jgi:hypothetical protein